MVLGLIIFIVCLLGIVGFYEGNLTLTYLGMILGIIEHIIGITTGQEKGLTTLWLAFWLAVGGTFAGNNFFEMLAICVCFENVICFGLGLLLFLCAGIGMLIYGKKEKETQKIIENVEYETEFFEELKRKNAEYDNEKSNTIQPLYCSQCGTKLEENDSLRTRRHSL